LSGTYSKYTVEWHIQQEFLPHLATAVEKVFSYRQKPRGRSSTFRSGKEWIKFSHLSAMQLYPSVRFLHSLLPLDLLRISTDILLLLHFISVNDYQNNDNKETDGLILLRQHGDTDVQCRRALSAHVSMTGSQILRHILD
jgi:hypothetical protein